MPCSITKLNTEAKRNFAKLFDFLVELEDNVYKSKVLRDISTLIAYMIDTFRNTEPFRNTKPDVCQKVVRKCQIETRTCHSWLFILAILRPNV